MRFQYHFEPDKGWMNDPNGLCFYQGQYHAFFQYNPYHTKWDTMHWGHAVSKDLVHWEQIETALYPDQEYENEGGCFSGSAMEKEGKLYLFYTSVSKHLGQTQSIATSRDGVKFEKPEENPIISHLPYVEEGGFSKDFRDPKVIRAFDKYYMVCGSEREGEGQILLYSSRDLLHWTYENVLFSSREYGGTLECPDLYPLGEEWILMFSAMKPTEVATVLIRGDFDGHSFESKEITYSEYGKDFYAPQTFMDDKGRRIMIGWFYHWGKELMGDVDYAGALSIPRELSLQNGRVANYPVEEARHLLIKECEYVKIEGTGISIFGLDGKPLYERDLKGINGIESIDAVDILFDQKAVEVFINRGRVSISQWLA